MGKQLKPGTKVRLIPTAVSDERINENSMRKSKELGVGTVVATHSGNRITVEFNDPQYLGNKCRYTNVPSDKFQTLADYEKRQSHKRSGSSSNQRLELQ